MSRILSIRKPRWTEARQLQEILETSERPGIRRRAEAVLLYAAGANATDIAEAMEVHPNTIYADLQAFGRHGVAGVRAWGSVGLPPCLTKLRDYLVKHRLLQDISREHLRRVLKKGACGCGGSKKSSSARTHTAEPFWPASAGLGGICHPKGCCSSST